MENRWFNHYDHSPYPTKFLAKNKLIIHQGIDSIVCLTSEVKWDLGKRKIVNASKAQYYILETSENAWNEQDIPRNEQDNLLSLSVKYFSIFVR